MSTLVITAAGGQHSTLELDRSRRYTVGRSETSDIPLSDPTLSREHAELYFDEDAWHVADRGSHNGTLLDGSRLYGSAPLRDGAVIALGCWQLTFDSRPASQISFVVSQVSSEGTLKLKVGEALPDTWPTDDKTELETVRRRYEVVRRATLELLAHEPMEVLLPKVLDLVLEAVRPDRVALLEAGENGEIVCRAFRGDEHHGMAVSRTIAETVLRDRVSVLTTDAQHDPRFAAGASIAAQGIRAVLAVPLWNAEQVIGLLYADSRLGSRKFTREDLSVLTALGNVAAIQIENAKLFQEQLEKRRIEEELRAAAEVQRRLLPDEPQHIPGFRFAGSNEPCRESGGDYFDCVSLGDDGRFAIALGDVAGKGVDAALLMAMLQATLHARAETAKSVRDLVDFLNAATVRAAPDNRFITLFLAALEPRTHRLRCVNAGHSPLPLVVHADKTVEEIATCGPPLGIAPGIEYRVVEVRLEPGDFVVACSDGATDARDAAGDFFGEERLKSLVLTLGGFEAEEIRRRIEEAVRAHAAGLPLADDLTLVVLQREWRSSGSFEG